MRYLKPIFAGLCASALTYLCFLAWVHSKATSAAEERGTIGLVPIASSQSYVLHSHNLGNLWRRLTLPKRIENWSLTSLQQRLVKPPGLLFQSFECQFAVQ